MPLLTRGQLADIDQIHSRHGYVMISHFEVWYEFTYPFPPSAVQNGDWERESNLAHTLLGMWLLIHAGIYVNPWK